MTMLDQLSGEKSKPDTVHQVVIYYNITFLVKVSAYCLPYRNTHIATQAITQNSV